MGRYVNSHIRITPSPAIRLPHPPLHRCLYYRLHPSGELLPWYAPKLAEADELADLGEGPRPQPPDRLPSDWGEGDAPDTIELPETEEIYLKLLTLDLASEDAILRFVNRYGVLGVRRNLFAEFREVLGHAFRRFTGEMKKAWPDEVRADFVSAQDRGAMELDCETLVEFRFGALLVRDLVLAWRALGEKEAPNAAAIEWQSLWWSKSSRSRGSQEVQRPDSREDIADFLKRGLESAMTPFRPQLLVGYGDARSLLDEDSWLASSGNRLKQVVPYGYPTLYDILCLELFNHIVEGARYLTCARCGQVFVRQTGRSRHHQYRLKGVMYCSWSCANAQAQKNYRDRRTNRNPARKKHVVADSDKKRRR